jgi:hypothetical protein
MASEAILSSSVAERSTVNRLVVGSNPTWGVLSTTNDRQIGLTYLIRNN